jgi:membrane protease YdiL (CAAX protease family)
MSKEEDNGNLDYRIKLIIVIILLLPLFFGYNIQYLFFNPLNTLHFIIISCGTIILLLFGYFFITPFINPQQLEEIKKHEVIDAFLRKDYSALYMGFLLSMILEELIFRFYIGGILIDYFALYLVVLLSSIIFSLYHIHIWFAFKNIRITLMYIGFSFLLGILNGFVLFSLGLFFCIILHYGIVLLCYWKIYTQCLKN